MNGAELKNIPALSIRQPWAWLITRPDLTDPAERRRECKDVENREWSTPFRGRVLIHTGKAKSKPKTQEEMEEAMDFVGLRMTGVRGPRPEELQWGGIVGMARIVDCVSESDSEWFTGPFGFVLEDVVPLPFVPCRGMLGFFMPRFEATEAELSSPQRHGDTEVGAEDGRKRERQH